MASRWYLGVIISVCNLYFGAHGTSYKRHYEDLLNASHHDVRALYAPRQPIQGVLVRGIRNTDVTVTRLRTVSEDCFYVMCIALGSIRLVRLIIRILLEVLSGRLMIDMQAVRIYWTVAALEISRGLNVPKYRVLSRPLTWACWF